MGIEEFFPVWGELGELERRALAEAAARRSAGAGAMIHGGGAECTGLLLVLSGQLRAFITSEEGREITIYRLFPGDICLLSASCVISSMQFELAVQAEKPTEFMLIPPDAYKRAVSSSAPLANYTSRVMAERLSDVMWLMEQVMWKSMDRRLAAFLAGGGGAGGLRRAQTDSRAHRQPPGQCARGDYAPAALFPERGPGEARPRRRGADGQGTPIRLERMSAPRVLRAGPGCAAWAWRPRRGS